MEGEKVERLLEEVTSFRLLSECAQRSRDVVHLVPGGFKIPELSMEGERLLGIDEGRPDASSVKQHATQTIQRVAFLNAIARSPRVQQRLLVAGDGAIELSEAPQRITEQA